jgi:GT2 family glycosyltransferase
MSERVYIILLNWNGWRDTVECLESVLRLDYPSFRVIVCDNGSTDGSLDRIQTWAAGKTAVDVRADNPLRRLTNPPVKKPAPVVLYDRSQAEQGGDLDVDGNLVVVRNAENLGFAAGNNVGLRYALARGDGDYYWLLNNDTVVEPDALTMLVDRMSARPDAGICGATIKSYADPERNVVLGGAVYGKWFATQKLIGAGATDVPDEPDGVESMMDYVAGASMLVSREFLVEIGLMSEDYFLYYEELDWAMRARGRYALVYAPRCIVYHKEGAAIGSSGAPLARTRAADYYEIRNRLTVTRKFFRGALPTVYVGLGLAALNRIRRGQWDRARMIAGIALGREP